MSLQMNLIPNEKGGEKPADKNVNMKNVRLRI